MNVELLGMQQEVDFRTGSTLTFIVLELPSGQRLRAAVDDDSAQVIVQAVAASGATAPKVAMPAVPLAPAPTPSIPISQSAAPQELDDDGSVVFGGQGVAAVAPTPAPQLRVAYVGKDEMGYPVVHARGGVDPGSVQVQEEAPETGATSI